MDLETKQKLKYLYLRSQLIFEHLRKIGILYVILIAGAAFIFLQYIPIGEVRYVSATVASYGGKPGAAGGVEYLVMKTEAGKTVSVGFVARPSVGDEFTLSVQNRIFPFSPIYRIHSAK